jgi:phenylacetate-CoA ligase
VKLEDWPLLEKEQVRDCPEAFLSLPKWMTIPASTSGTTGTPLKLYRSLSSIVVEQAAIDWALYTHGLDFSKARIAVLRGDNIKDLTDMHPPFWRDEAKGRKRVFSSNHLSRATLSYFLGALREFQPECLYAYPSVLESLCRLILQSGEQLQVQYVVTSSEQPSPTLGVLITQVLQACWIDYYGLAERNAFAYLRNPDGYYFLPGYGWIEFYPVNTTSEGTIYEIVATSLWNLAMPLVRYRTGDTIVLSDNIGESELVEIQWGLRPFTGIRGRSGDYLIAPDGAILMGIDHIPRDVSHVARMQVVQESKDLVRILVLPLPGYSQADEAQILANARSKLPPTMRVQVEVVEQLERTAQGKTPFVIRKI